MKKKSNLLKKKRERQLMRLLAPATVIICLIGIAVFLANRLFSEKSETDRDTAAPETIVSRETVPETAVSTEAEPEAIFSREAASDDNAKKTPEEARNVSPQEPSDPGSDSAVSPQEPPSDPVSGSVVSSQEDPSDPGNASAVSPQEEPSDPGSASVEEPAAESPPSSPPEITLIGGNEITLEIFSPYADPGYTAMDAEDGDLTAQVLLENAPDMNVPGDTAVRYRVVDSAGMESTVERLVHVVDTTPPEIILEGDREVSLAAGTPWTDPGFLAQDNLDGDLTDRMTIESDLDPQTEGTYTIHYHVEDSTGNAAGAARTVTVYRPQETPAPSPPEGGRIVYLTFDDGPGAYTARLLDILDQYNVKATFFVTAQAPDYLPLIAEEARRGHTVAIHSWSHHYDEIYASDEAYWADYNRMNDVIEQMTGTRTNILRFPGGSSNIVSRNYSQGIMSRLTSSAETMGLVWCDWNVSAEDAVDNRTPEGVAARVIAGIQANPVSVVLQHDICEHTVDAMPEILSWGLANGCTFLPVTASTPEMHLQVRN